MEELKNILNNLGISKVKLAKYLGVSRQMVYNYLELDNINKWPKEKKILLFKLLNVEDGNPETLDKIKINTEYLEAVEDRLNSLNKTNNYDLIDIKGLNKQEQVLLSDFTFLLKEKLSRTQQLNTVKIQALRELGYNEINASNAAEVFEKIAEIQSRGV